MRGRLWLTRYSSPIPKPRGSTTRSRFRFSRSSAQAGELVIRVRPNIQTLVSRRIHSSRILTVSNLLTDLFQLQQNCFCAFVELPLSLETIAVLIRQRIDTTAETKALQRALKAPGDRIPPVKLSPVPVLQVLLSLFALQIIIK